MLGYWNAPEATAAKGTGGWLLTGDLAHADEAGQIFFHGRDDDIIKSGGSRPGPAGNRLRAARGRTAMIGRPQGARGKGGQPHCGVARQPGVSAMSVS